MLYFVTGCVRLGPMRVLRLLGLLGCEGAPALRAALVVSAGLLISACGGDSDSDDRRSENLNTGGKGESAGGAGGSNGGRNGGGPGNSGGSSIGGSGGREQVAGCPAAPPMPGAACEVSVLPNSPNPGAADCTWGDDPRPNCRTQALCADGQWQVTEGNGEVCDAPALAAECGDTPRTPMSECENVNAECWYPNGDRCACSNCQGGSGFPVCQEIDPPQWACFSPQAGCPATIPQAGSPCSKDGLSCGPNCELQVICAEGKWRWQQGQCPICASPETPIATPEGERRLGDLQAGDLVYSVHGGAVVPVPVLLSAHTEVVGHTVLRVVLDSGRVLEVSAGHPLSDPSLTFGQLRPGEPFDELHHVASVERVPYAHAATYDILPDSDSGTYFAAGAQVGSSLLRR